MKDGRPFTFAGRWEKGFWEQWVSRLWDAGESSGRTLALLHDEAIVTGCRKSLFCEVRVLVPLREFNQYRAKNSAKQFAKWHCFLVSISNVAQDDYHYRR
jgi:hypothetical protein